MNAKKMKAYLYTRISGLHAKRACLMIFKSVLLLIAMHTNKLGRRFNKSFLLKRSVVSTLLACGLVGKGCFSKFTLIEGAKLS